MKKLKQSDLLLLVKQTYLWGPDIQVSTQIRSKKKGLKVWPIVYRCHLSIWPLSEMIDHFNGYLSVNNRQIMIKINKTRSLIDKFLKNK